VAGLWFLAVGFVFGAEVVAGIPGVLVVLVLVGLNAIAWGTIGAAIALNSGSPSVAQGIFPIVFVILFLSSAFFPENLLLEPARTIAEWNPMSMIANGLRDPIISELSFDKTLEALAGIAIVTSLGAVLCARGLNKKLKSA
jgi:ABC-2 type transport system permease protein